MRCAPRIELDHDLPGLAEFLDDDVARVLFDDAFEIRKHVARIDEEARRDASHGFVLGHGDGYTCVTGPESTFARDGDLLAEPDAEAQLGRDRDLFDLLVGCAKRRLR